ncbi:hypothetical protein [Clostridium thermarum]|uniref:hypothetical protein n=1 Tax=Clostridium thermarum TaxID=1716543 RepID=UPI0011215266|nr:hypothetical protein [Clostridium thermarum]
MDRLLIIIVIVFLVFSLLTYLLHRLFKKARVVKYLPAILCLIITIVNIVIARSGTGEGFGDLARIIIAMITFAGFISGMLSALWFDYIASKSR